MHLKYTDSNADTYPYYPVQRMINGMRGTMRIATLVIVLSTLSPSGVAQEAGSKPIVPGMPASFHWRNDPAGWNVSDGVLTIRSTGKTDWYAAPTSGAVVGSSPLLLFPAPRDFWFSAK